MRKDEGFLPATEMESQWRRMFDLVYFTDAAKRYPHLFAQAEETLARFKEYMEAELRIVSSAIVGAWFLLILVTGISEVHIPAFSKTGIVMIAITLGYWGYRKLAWRMKFKEIKNTLRARIRIEEEGGLPD